jgi:two-component system, OmpR family, sensor histidine kinase BaeS
MAAASRAAARRAAAGHRPGGRHRAAAGGRRGRRRGALRTTRPIARLADVTRRYGAGERDLRAPTSGPDEVADLGRVFNDTADRLQAEEDQRRRFTTDVAHELRTPLTVLKSELEAIQDGLMAADPATVAQLLQQVDLLTRLVQDLRLLTLAEAGELTLHREPSTSPPWSARRARSARAPRGGRAPRGRRRARARRRRRRPAASGRQRPARQRAAPRPAASEVRVAVARAGRGRHRGARRGPGHPARAPGHVFRRLYRTDDARVREAGGSGPGARDRRGDRRPPRRHGRGRQPAHRRRGASP